MTNSKKRKWLSTMSLLPCALISTHAHARSIKPDTLESPKAITCLDIKQPMSFIAKRGLLNIPWETRLERGPYVSEKADAQGTYYRAPPGGVKVGRPDLKGKRYGYANHDGGVYVPNDPREAPTIYEYFSVASAPAEIPPTNMDCSTVAYIRDPSTQKISVLAMAFGTGMGAAAGEMIGRSVHPQVRMSYGQAAGVGLVGGLIGGVIAAAIINAKVGKIVPGPDITDVTFLDQLKMLAANKVSLSDSGRPLGNAPALAAQLQGAVDVNAAEPSARSVVDAKPTDASLAAAASSSARLTDATAIASAPVKATTASATVANPAMTSMAQDIARQNNCGAVQANGDGTYIAPCDSYGLLIDCTGEQCRPMHTVKMKVDE